MNVLGFHHPHDVWTHGAVGGLCGCCECLSDVGTGHANPMGLAFGWGGKRVDCVGCGPQRNVLGWGRGQSAPCVGVHQHLQGAGQAKRQGRSARIHVVAGRLVQVPLVQRHAVPVPCAKQVGRLCVSVSQGVNHHRHMLAADVVDFPARPAAVVEGVQVVVDGRDGFVTVARGVSLHEHPSHRHFSFWFFGQAHPHRVAEAVLQEGADAQGGFDPAVFAVAGFRHAQMQRKGHVFLGHSGHKQTVRLHHHLRVGGLHRHHDVVVTFVHANPQEFQGAFHHPQGRVSVPTHDAVGQGPVVGADAHGPSKALALLDQGREFLPDANELFRVRFVGVLEVLKPLFVGIVAGIHADFLHVVGRDFCGVGREVDVRHQRRLVP